jgi:mannitol/fructose-specific phosphotransferase system IIA component (Ntr-type)/ActR/RegA family two-component response regulator
MVADALALERKARPPRIVVVDDEQTLLDVYEMILGSHFKDATILPFLDGDEAWLEISRTPPDVLITDMARSSLSGWEMLPLLAAQKCKFPVVVVTGSADEKDVRQCAGNELNLSYLAKPYQINLLSGLLESLFKGHRATAPESALRTRPAAPKNRPAIIHFSAEHIISNLRSRERFAAIREMVAHLITIGQIRPHDEELVLDAISKREGSMSTGLGFGIAIPRGRVHCVEDIILAFGVSTSGVEFDALDNQPAKLILLSILPANSWLHEGGLMKSDGPFLRFLHNEDNRAQLLHSNSTNEVWSILKPVYTEVLASLAESSRMKSRN